MNEIDNEKLADLVRDARSKRGGKPTKYTGYNKYPEIIELIKRDVQLPYILKWLTEQNGEKLVLNTLRKYVVFKIGRIEYEEYLKRNGWLKPRKTLPRAPTKTQPAAQPQTDQQTQEEGDFFLNLANLVGEQGASNNGNGFKKVVQQIKEKDAEVDPRRTTE